MEWKGLFSIAEGLRTCMNFVRRFSSSIQRLKVPSRTHRIRS